MRKSKKSAVGHVAVWMLLSGELERIGNGLNVKTVRYYSLETILLNAWKTDLSGLKNGYWNGRLLRH
jgi:hypothetical protein